MSKWIAEFELEDGDTMPEHMDLHYMGGKIDFHCKPLEQEPILDKIRAKINTMPCVTTLNGEIYVNRDEVNNIIDKYKAESEE